MKKLLSRERPQCQAVFCSHSVSGVYFLFINYIHACLYWAFQVALVIKNPPAEAGDLRDASSIPGSGRSLGGGHSSPLQYSCLENSMDTETWWASVYRVTKCWTPLQQLSMYSCDFIKNIIKTYKTELQGLSWWNSG